MIFVIFSVSFVLSFILAGRGARFLRGNHKRGARSLPAVAHSLTSLKVPSQTLLPYLFPLFSRIIFVFLYCMIFVILSVSLSYRLFSLGAGRDF